MAAHDARVRARRSGLRYQRVTESRAPCASFSLIAPRVKYAAHARTAHGHPAGFRHLYKGASHLPLSEFPRERTKARAVDRSVPERNRPLIGKRESPPPLVTSAVSAGAAGS